MSQEILYLGLLLFYLFLVLCACFTIPFALFRSLARSVAGWPTMQRSIRPFIIGAISCRITITAQVNNDANTSRAHYDQIASEAAARPQQGTERSGACQGNPFLKSNAARERCIRRRDWYAPQHQRRRWRRRQWWCWCCWRWYCGKWERQRHDKRSGR